MNRQLFKCMVLCIIGGLLYYAIEIAFRGYSNWTMMLLGAWCFVALGMMNEIIPWSMPLSLQIIIGEIIVLVSEFITGCIVNIWLGWNVWDYSNLPGNLLGQISWQFAILWIPLILFGIVLDDWVRWKFFNEEMPTYHLV